MMDRRFYEDLEAGMEFRSPSRTVTETDVVQFSGLSGDYSRIHVDHEFAAQTMFGRPIAHGLLVVAISSGLTYAGEEIEGAAYLGLSRRFRKPVFFGDTISTKRTIAETRPSKTDGLGVVRFDVEVVNQAGDVVHTGDDWELVSFRD